jgi:hypothetical protein
MTRESVRRTTKPTEAKVGPSRTTVTSKPSAQGRRDVGLGRRGFGFRVLAAPLTCAMTTTAEGWLG